MTATLIPPQDVDLIEVKSERDVCGALLRTLGSGCTVFHSYPWLRPDRNDWKQGVTLREGEVDLVVLDPSRGLLVLEVKGGEISYAPADRRWFRRKAGGGTKRIKDPFEQARSGMHQLVDQVRQRAFPGADRLPGVIGYAVAFPDCDFTGELPPGADGSILLGTRDLPSLGRRVEQILDRWDQGQAPALTPEQARRIRDALLPAFRLIPSLTRRHEEESAQLLRLTERQQVLLKCLVSNRQMLIEGPAGSGKTTLAMQRARELAATGARTLFLCFNRALAEWLESSASCENLTVRHFHRLVHDLCVKARVPFEPPEDDARFWTETAPNLLVDALDRVADRYDAIVVDEGQDFHASWWLPIVMLNREEEKGPLYVFYDRHQNLFDSDLLLPAQAFRFTLPANCRNTQRIAGLCGGVRGIDMPVWRAAPQGEEARILRCSGPDECREQAEAIAADWLHRGKKPSEIAILGPHKLKRSCFAGRPLSGKVPLTPEFAAWHANKGVLYSTVRAFKGLEADGLVIVDADEFGPGFTRSDLYVACSRARHDLAVITSSDEVNEVLSSSRVVVMEG